MLFFSYGNKTDRLLLAAEKEEIEMAERAWKLAKARRLRIKTFDLEAENRAGVAARNMTTLW